MGHNNDHPNYLLQPSQIEELFSKIAVDIIGPLQPTQKKKKYILTVVDFGTRFLEAIPLSNISAANVARSLLSHFCKFNWPKTVFLI